MIFSVVRAGWLNLRRDPAALMLSFIVPIVFFSIFAGIFGAQRSKTGKVRVAVADTDQTANSKRLVQALKKESTLNVVLAPKNGPPFTAASAEEWVRAGEGPVALIIPKGFGESKMQFDPQAAKTQPVFKLLNDSADPIAEQVVAGMLQKVVMTAMPDMMARSGVDTLDQWSGGLTPEQRQRIDTSINQFTTSTAGGSASGGNDGMLARVESTDLMGKDKKNVVAAMYAASIGVMFLLFTATNAGGALLEEQENGTLDRVLSTRLSMTKLMLGKLVYLWMLGMLQLTVMFTWGAIVFKLELLKHLDGFLIMAAATTLATSAFGLLLASIARSRAQLAAISTLTVLSISAIGGSMFPRFLMPESVRKAGLVFFNSWALDGFNNVFWREEPLSSIVLPVVVLVAWGVVFFVIARQLTRRWELA